MNVERYSIDMRLQKLLDTGSDACKSYVQDIKFAIEKASEMREMYSKVSEIFVFYNTQCASVEDVTNKTNM